MSDGMLSQDQIDALSQGAQLDDIGSDSSGGTDDNSVDITRLSKACEILSEQSSTVLSTVLGKEVNVTAGNTEPASADKIQTAYGKDHLVLSVQFTKGFDSPVHFIISKKDTAILADLMMMGDGEAEYEEDHKDAIGELFNQIMGATSTSYGIQFNMECSVDPATVNDFDPNENAIKLAECFSTTIGLNIQGITETSLVLLIPNNLGAEIAEKVSTGDKKEESTETTDNIEEGSGSLGTPQASVFNASAMQTSMPQQVNNATPSNINMLLDIQLQVAIELGRTEMSIKRILELGPGSIIELDRMAGEPVDLLVNGKIVAKGEVVVVDENFGIRIVSLVSPEERLKSLK